MEKGTGVSDKRDGKTNSHIKVDGTGFINLKIRLVVKKREHQGQWQST
jgi:hypothetical protein